MLNLSLERFLKTAASHPAVGELLESVRERVVNVKPHRDIVRSDWGTESVKVVERMKESRRLIVYNGPLGRVNDFGQALAMVFPDRYYLDLGSMLSPLYEGVSSQVCGFDDLDRLIGRCKLDPKSLTTRIKGHIHAVLMHWNDKLLVTYDGADFFDFREIVVLSRGFFTVWVPTPEQFILDMFKLARVWSGLSDVQFNADLGVAIAQTLNHYVLNFERMNGFYGKNACAFGVRIQGSDAQIEPLSLDEFKESLLLLTEPSAYADLLVGDQWEAALRASGIEFLQLQMDGKGGENE